MSHLDTMSPDELLGFSIKQAKQVYRYKGRFSEVYVYLSIYLSIYLSLFIYLFIFSLVDGVVQVVAEGEGEIGTNAATESGQIIEKNIRIERGALLKKIN